MSRLFLATALLILAASALSAQAIIESMIGASTGTAGAVGAQIVSKGVNGIFGKVLETTKKVDQVTRDTAPAAFPDAPSPFVTSLRATTASKRSAKSTPASFAPSEPAIVPEFMPTLAMPPLPVIPRLTTQQIAAVQPGATRDDILASLGRPSSRIVIPESGHLVELYQYTNKGQTLGNLRLTDGIVTSVRPALP